MVFQGGKLSLRAGVGQEQTVSQDESHDHWIEHRASRPHGACQHKSCGEGEPEAPGSMERAPHWESTDLTFSPNSALTSELPGEASLLWASVSPSVKEGCVYLFLKSPVYDLELSLLISEKKKGGNEREMNSFST